MVEGDAAVLRNGQNRVVMGWFTGSVFLPRYVRRYNKFCEKVGFGIEYTSVFRCVWQASDEKQQVRTLMKFSRADSRVRMWRFTDVSRANSVPIFRVCWWFGSTKTDVFPSWTFLGIRYQSWISALCLMISGLFVGKQLKR